MKIEHLAIWVNDLEAMRSFYSSYFDGVSGEKYINTKKGFTSYFISFAGGGARLEIMHKQDIQESTVKKGFIQGIAHFAISTGSKEAVDILTERLRADKYTIESEPRTTGDGYYESAVLDPEGNYVEISE